MTSLPSDTIISTKPRVVSAIVAVAFFMQMLDSTIIVTSLPAMAEAFGTDVVSLNIGFTAYLLAMAVCIPPAGWLSDRLGARDVFLFAIILFTLSSAACGFARSLPEFTLARIVQGASAALMTPVGRQLVLRGTPKAELVRAIATITWPALIAPVVGPLIGAWISTTAGWEWNFYINLPIGLAGALLVAVFVPREAPDAVRPFDGIGFALTGGALALGLAGLEFLSTSGATALSVALVASGSLAGAAAIRHLGRHPHALLDLSVTHVPTFAMATLVAGTAGRVAINATPFLLPLLFQVGFGFNAVETGFFVLVYFLGNLLMKTVTTPALKLFGFRRLLVINGVVAALSVAAFALVSADTSAWVLYPLLMIAGLTRSMQFTCMNTLAFADVATVQRSAATTISAMLQQLSQLLGVAVSAAVIRTCALVRDGGADLTALIDIRAAFVVVGIIGLGSALRFLALAENAGAEVSGCSRGAIKP